MEALGHILLQMDAGEADLLTRSCNRFLSILGVGCFVQGNAAAEAERLIVLRDLVVLRHVRIVVVLPVELADFGNIAAEHESRTGGESQRFTIHDG